MSHPFTFLQEFLYFCKDQFHFTRFSFLPMLVEEFKLRSPVFIWITVCLTGLLLFTDVFQSFRYNLQVSLQPKLLDPLPQNAQSMRGYLVKTEGCKIPEMDPYDLSVRSFLSEEKPVKCDNGRPPLVDSNLTSIFVLRTSMPFYGILDRRKLRCQYTPFSRIEPGIAGKDNKIVFGQSVNFSNEVVIREEFVMVECFYTTLNVYKDFFAFVPLKENQISNDQNPSVLVIGLDSVSRLNFHRQMPKTKRILEKIKAVELLGYNKVGDNTFPNLMPLLTGLSEEELKANCWHNSSFHFDNCPFIWKQFKEQKYTTAFGEDSAWMGTFNYQKMGFFKQPTDYYWCPFNMIAEKQIGNQHRLNVQQCVGSREVYTTLLDYITKFVTQMNRHKQKFFGFFWQNSLSHDLLNKLKLGDTNYANFISNLFANKILKNTVLIFLSDHGMRWGSIRSTYQGSIEERLPLIYIYLPYDFKEKYSTAYSNLLRNKQRLTTPFDLHRTLYALTDPESNLRNVSKPSKNYSLFDVIPENRTCDSASIASHWCTCQESSKLSVNDSVVVETALYSVKYINDLLNGTECNKLSVKAILDARKQGHSGLSQKNYFEDITVIINTLPGDAMFESTIRKRYFKGKHTLEIIGTINLAIWASPEFWVELNKDNPKFFTGHVAAALTVVLYQPLKVKLS